MSTVSQEQQTAGSLVKLLATLQAINPASSSAEQNAESIDDNNGGRILL